MAQVEFAGGQLEVTINRARAYALTSEDTLIFGRAIEEYLVPGKNQLRVKLIPTPRPVQPIFFLSRVARFEPKDPFSFKAGQELARVTKKFAPPPDQTPPPPKVPLVAEAEFRIDAPWSWPWSKAPPLKLDASTRRAVDRFMKRAHEAFTKRDLAFFQKRLETYLKAMEQKYEHEKSGKLRRSLNALFTKDMPWKVAPYVPQPDHYHLAVGDRFVHCVDGSGQALLRLEPPSDGGRSIEFPMLLWRFGDHFEIVK